ncbi:MAG: hypothetical protein HW421_1380 [Ignavibacteria bacterium]|nr:hypothetical protein [Ignavibacteria bacterium]
MKSGFLYISLSVILSIILSGCYADTVSSLERLTVQVPIMIQYSSSGNSDRTEQPMGRDIMDLLDTNKAYKDNKDRIEDILIYQGAFWLDQTDPWVPQETFQTVRFFVKFGSQQYLIAQYDNVVLPEYVGTPHLSQTDEATSAEISKRLLNKEQYSTIAEIKRMPGIKTDFKTIPIHLVLTARITINLSK